MKTTTTATAALLQALLWLGTSMRALGAEVRITSVDGFIQFKDNVNSGTNYSGTTVFLDDDIDFTGKSFEPIGIGSNYFHGVFDGQGYAISNLAMASSSSQDNGLFGYSKGLTAIKNVILDSSCSITSSFSGSGFAFIGGIIGSCEANYGPCNIENSVNMGSVTFRGSVSSSSLNLGGIAGGLYSSSKHDSIMKNCANYGDVTHSGEIKWSFIGGIVGESSGYSSNKGYIYNCLNHGTITHNGTSSNLYFGGVTGSTYYTTIENCVSGGKISFLTKPSKDNYIGGIVGYVNPDTSINYCYFTSDLSDYKKYSAGTPSSESNTLSYDSTTFKLSGTVSIGGYTGNSLIEALNAAADYYTLRDYSHWLLNKGNNAVTFTINGNSPFALNSQVILLPSLASEGNMSFDGWYKDNGLTTPLTEYEVTSDTELYGKYCNLPNYTVTLDVNGGDKLQPSPNAVVCDDIYLALPDPTRTGHTFLGWFTERTGGDKIEAGNNVTILINHTLYAHWSINKYSLTFIFNNGTEPEVRVLEFNEEITYPADPVRAGYSFISWDSDITNMPADNTTITAQWTPNNYTVTFNTNGGSISQSTKVVTFGSAYGDLPTPNRTGHTFLGWFTEKNESITEESIVKIPGNHTLYAHWTAPSSGGKTSNPTIIVGVIVLAIVVIVVIAVIVVLVLYSRMKKKVERDISEGRFEFREPLIDSGPPSDDGYCRVVALTKEEFVANVPKKRVQSILTHLYPEGYTRPTMKEALTEVDLTEEQVEMVCSACETAAQKIADEVELLEEFTEEDAAAVAMYTYDFGPKDFESNPYRIINRSLVGRNFAEIQKVSGLLYLVMSALRKLPRVTGRTLYRGVRGEVSLDEGYYHKGNVVTWSALSSTSPDLGTTKAFLAKGSKDGEATGTLFIIDKGWGYDIKPYSLFPDEEEILLEPERQFRVASVLKAALTIVNLEMLDTPLSVPEVFGGCK